MSQEKQTIPFNFTVNIGVAEMIKALNSNGYEVIPRQSLLQQPPDEVVKAAEAVGAWFKHVSAKATP